MVYDYVIIGSGFGGSVAALRLTEKGYKVLIIERGRKFSPNDFPKSNLNLKKLLWLPLFRFFGITELSFFSHVLVQHGSGYGGGSLSYANVLLQPDSNLLASTKLGKILQWEKNMPFFFQKAKKMLGTAPNPNFWPIDFVFKNVAKEFNSESSFEAPEVGVYFGKPGKEVEDPYFSGEGPMRTGCTHCGSCMIGCPIGAKNTLDKNYLYLAEKLGAEVKLETEVIEIIPYNSENKDRNNHSSARYILKCKNSSSFLSSSSENIFSKNTIVSAGVIGTMKLLLHCRDIKKSLPHISKKLGNSIRTNGESLLTVTRLDNSKDHSRGIAITSIFKPDEYTNAQIAHFPKGSSLLQWLSVPAIFHDSSFVPFRLFKLCQSFFKSPREFIQIKFAPQWATRSILLLVMQANKDKNKLLQFKLKRSFLKMFHYKMDTDIYSNHPAPSETTKIAHDIAHKLAKQNNAGVHISFAEGILKIPTTAHILGGCPIGETDKEGVISKECEVFNYPGLFVIDGSIITEDIGVNPALTITALAEYAVSHIKDINHEK